jgi:tryptophan 2,3-dioxygenase
MFLRYLACEGYPVPESLLVRDVAAPVESSADARAIIVSIYRRDAKNAELCERLVDLDEGVQEWRYRHVKMVERSARGTVLEVRRAQRTCAKRSAMRRSRICGPSARSFSI